MSVDQAGSPRRRLALEDGYFTITGDGDREACQLIGSYSQAADEHFFPRRKRCPITFEPVEDRLLSRKGVLYSWTWIANLKYGSMSMGGGEHGVGQIDLPEGVRVQSRIAGEMGDWEIGMEMEVALLPITTDSEGNELCTFWFKPVKGS